ncbi:MAG: DUF4157 domain-containing protein [Bacteroidia bacterium]|nr:DUF4157 domain-containing protein [Bacteroidia bacterium]
MASPQFIRRQRRGQGSKSNTPFAARHQEADTFFNGGPAIQPKLTIGAPGDRYEQEADAVAERVVSGQPAAPTAEGQPSVQMKCAACEEEGPVQRMAGPEEEEPVQMEAAPEEEEPVQMEAAPEEEEPVQMEAAPEEEPVQMEAAPEEEEPVQTKADGSRTASPDFASRLQARQGGGQPLPTPVRRQMEQGIGADFSGVRIHTDTEAAHLNHEISAHAFTRGQDVYFNAGRYQPESTAGQRLLAHELTHVVQQGGGGKTHDQVPDIQGGLWSSIKKAAGKVWGGVKKAGSAIVSGAKAAWKGISWFGKKLWEKFSGIGRRVYQWITLFPGRVGRLLKGLWQGLKTFKPWTLSWWKSLGKADTWKGFLKWVGYRLVEMLEIMGIGEIYETVADFIKFNTRTLTSGEIATAKKVFGNTINYGLVRVDEGAVIGPAFSDRPYTSFHTINSWGSMSNDVLLHELTHVWQYEHAGAIYMPQAIHAQVWGDGYEYGGVAGLQQKKNAGQGLLSFNREQQAQIIQDFFRLKSGQSPDGATTTDLPLYADFVQAVSSHPVAALLTN